MDIRQLRYFVILVQENCNISKASARLFISQPGLSKLINEFERSEECLLFLRKNGRLVGLTSVGRIMYQKALEILDVFDNGIQAVRDMAMLEKDHIRIGVPEFLLATLFSEIIPQMVVEHPEAKIIIYELNGETIKKRFNSHDLDIAILLQPTEFSDIDVEQVLVKSEPMVAFMNVAHNLANRQSITWHDISQYPLSLPQKQNTIYKILESKFHEENLHMKIGILASNWNYLLLSSRTNNLITILPAFTNDILKIDKIVSVSIQNTVWWNVAVCRHKVDVISKFHNFVFKKLISIAY